jgi:hypothetical protein
MASLTVRNIPNDAKARFRTIAAAHGRSMEEHLRQLVIEAGVGNIRGPDVLREKPLPYRAEPSVDEGDWVAELMERAKGVEFSAPQWRGIERIAPSYPEGMEPLPGESFVDHISRISRPGFDLEIERDRTPHGEPRV